jgi:hypothetical protein
MDTEILYKQMERKGLQRISRQYSAGISLENCVTFEFHHIHTKRMPDLTMSTAVVQVELGTQIIVIYTCKGGFGTFQGPQGLRRKFKAALLLRVWVRIPLEAWVSVCCECRVLSVEVSATS